MGTLSMMEYNNIMSIPMEKTVVKKNNFELNPDFLSANEMQH